MKQKLESQGQVKQWRSLVRAQKEQKNKINKIEEQKEKKKLLNRQTKRVQDDLNRKSEVLRMQRILKEK